MKYRNTVTGEVVEINSVISGGNWQAVKPASVPIDKTASVEATKTGSVKTTKPATKPAARRTKVAKK